MVLLLKKAVGKTVIQILSMVSLINLSEVERETVWGTERWILYVTFCVYLAREISFFSQNLDILCLWKWWRSELFDLIKFVAYWNFDCRMMIVKEFKWQMKWQTECLYFMLTPHHFWKFLVMPHQSLWQR